MPNITALIVVATVMFCVLGGVTLLTHIYNLNNIKSKTVGDGQHGTARFSTKAEIRRIYKQVPFTPEEWRKKAKKNTFPNLPHRAKLVYLYLHDRMDKERKAWPGIKTIAQDLSISRSTVKRAIKDLEKARLIRKEPHYRENGSATSNRYYIL